MQYNLSHLNQTTCEVIGPIQDDEALFLYALIKVMGLKYVVEVGGLSGYSAQNFLCAIPSGGKVVTIEPQLLIPLADNHNVITKLAHMVTVEDIGLPHIDLIFFDAHEEDSQMTLFHSLCNAKIIDDKTIIVLHDTGTHPVDIWNLQKLVSDNNHNNANNGFVHQVPERNMSNSLMDLGYCPLHLAVNNNDLPIDNLTFRHGLTILNKPYKLI